MRGMRDLRSSGWQAPRAAARRLKERRLRGADHLAVAWFSRNITATSRSAGTLSSSGARTAAVAPLSSEWIHGPGRHRAAHATSTAAERPRRAHQGSLSFLGWPERRNARSVADPAAADGRPVKHLRHAPR